MKQNERCVVESCNRNVSSNISLFRFPKDPIRSRLWMERIGRRDLLSKSPEYIWKHCRICGEHFDTESFTTNKRNRLMPESIPTIFSKELEVNTQSCVTIYEENCEDSVDDDDLPLIQSCRSNVEPELSPLCRGCMSDDKSNLTLLLEPTTLSVFQQCTRLKVNSDDGLSNAICCHCLSACRLWADFQAQCMHTESKLMSLKFGSDNCKSDDDSRFTNGFTDACNECMVCSTCGQEIYGSQYMDHVCFINVGPDDDNGEGMECAPDIGEYEDDDDDSNESGSTIELEDLKELIPLEIDSHIELKDLHYEKVPDEDVDEDVRKLDSFKPYKCTKCDWRFKCLKRFSEHKQFHEFVDEVKCRACDIVFKQALDLTKHCRLIHPNERLLNYVCKECAMSFASYERLKVHASRHSGKKDKMCNQCGELFILISDLRMHIFRKHTDHPKVHKCEECHKIFESVHTMRAHQRIVHVKERAFVCEICSKAFKRNAQLRAHILTHVEPKVCEKCQRRFKSDSAFKMHSGKCIGLPSGACARLKRRQTLKRPIAVCPLCTHDCPNIRGLEEHLKQVHRNEDGIDMREVIDSVKQEQCKHCGKRYFDKFALNLHANKVHKQKRIECEHCNRMFRDHGTLRSHIAAAHKNKADIPGQLEMFLTQKEILSGQDPFLKDDL